MLKLFSVKRLLARLRPFVSDSLSKLRNLKDKSVKHPFIIALLLSVLVHAIALAVPIFSSSESESTLDGEDTEQVEESEEDLEDEGVEEGDEPLDVDELPPGPEDDLDDDTSDSEDDSGDDLDDDTSDSEDDSGDDLDDDTSDSGDDSGNDLSDDTSDSGDDSGDDFSDASDDGVDTTTPPEADPEENSNNIPEPPDEDPGDTSASTSDTENDSEDTADSTPDEDNPEKPVEVAQSNAFAQIADYKNARPLLCGLKIAQKDKNSRFTRDPLNRVSSYFGENLDKNGYQPKLVLDSPDTKVYQISKDGQAGYLHLFDKSGEGTIILFSQERIDCDRLNIQSLKPEDSQEVEKSEESENTQESEKSEESENTQESEESEELEKKPEQTQEEKVFEKTFANLYEELGWTKDVITAQENKNQPPTPEMETVFGADVDKTPDELVSVVKSKLEEQGFETSQIEDYTDGILYEIKKGEFTKYITFTPNLDDNTKMTIATWKSIPVAPQKG